MQILKLESKTSVELLDGEIIGRSHNKSSLSAPRFLLLAALLMIVTLFANWPAINAGLPFFYNEDEAHHFNRVVEMVKTGDYNPHYFLKPSLHFYLRMPVVAASFLWNVRQGHILSLKDIRTRDPNGLSGYSLTASHPGIVKWQRLFSLGLCFGAIILTAFLSYKLTGAVSAALITGLVLSVSPAIFLYGSTIGVDAPMLFFSVAAIFFSYLHLVKKTWKSLVLASICAGLAMSSKYNALPIVIAPIVATLLNQPLSFGRLLIAFTLPVLAFFAGSPYTLLSLPEFLDHFAYEIWHYGIAIREGHTANPGLEQIWLYGKWMFASALGPVAFLLSLLGIVTLLRSNPRAALVIFLAIGFYFTLMVMQRTHFERNMLVVLPALALAAGIAASELVKRFRIGGSTVLTWLLLILAAISPLVFITFNLRADLTSKIDSRITAFNWINENTPPLTSTALSGTLQLPLFQVTQAGQINQSIKGLRRFAPNELNFLRLYLQGIDRVIIGPEVSEADAVPSGFKLTKEFPGIEEKQRVIKNPRIRIYAVDLDSVPAQFTQLDEKVLNEIPSLSSQCSQLADGQCWIQTRIIRVTNNESAGLAKATRLTFSAFSPWPNQYIRLITDGRFTSDSIEIGKDWQSYSLNLPAGQNLLMVNKVINPQEQGLSSDNRYLGIAYKDVKIEY